MIKIGALFLSKTAKINIPSGKAHAYISYIRIHPPPLSAKCIVRNSSKSSTEPSPESNRYERQVKTKLKKELEMKFNSNLIVKGDEIIWQIKSSAKCSLAEFRKGLGAKTDRRVFSLAFSSSPKIEGFYLTIRLCRFLWRLTREQPKSTFTHRNRANNLIVLA